jgi:hypothetical protein
MRKWKKIVAMALAVALMGGLGTPSLAEEGEKTVANGAGTWYTMDVAEGVTTQEPTEPESGPDETGEPGPAASPPLVPQAEPTHLQGQELTTSTGGNVTGDQFLEFFLGLLLLTIPKVTLSFGSGEQYRVLYFNGTDAQRSVNLTAGTERSVDWGPMSLKWTAFDMHNQTGPKLEAVSGNGKAVKVTAPQCSNQFSLKAKTLWSSESNAVYIISAYDITNVKRKIKASAGAPFYAGPSKDCHPKLATIPDDTQVTISGTYNYGGNKWYYLQNPNKPGQWGFVWHSYIDQDDTADEAHPEDNGSEESGGSEAILWPVKDVVSLTDIFGYRNSPVGHHNGIDIPCRKVPVFTVMSGEVRDRSVWTGGGRTIKVRHAHGYYTVYMHLSAYNVNMYDEVAPDPSYAAANAIAISGASGTDANGNLVEEYYGYHLHFQLQRGDGRRYSVNPLSMYSTYDKRYNSTNPNPFFKHPSSSSSQWVFNTSFNWTYSNDSYYTGNADNTSGGAAAWKKS